MIRKQLERCSELDPTQKASVDGLASKDEAHLNNFTRVIQQMSNMTCRIQPNSATKSPLKALAIRVEDKPVKDRTFAGPSPSIKLTRGGSARPIRPVTTTDAKAQACLTVTHRALVSTSRPWVLQAATFEWNIHHWQKTVTGQSQ